MCLSLMWGDGHQDLQSLPMAELLQPPCSQHETDPGESRGQEEVRWTSLTQSPQDLEDREQYQAVHVCEAVRPLVSVCSKGQLVPSVQPMPGRCWGGGAVQGAYVHITWTLTS